MEKFFEKSEIMSAPVQLFTMSFMREVMADVGRQLDEGLILIADDVAIAKHFVKAYVTKAENGKILGRKMQKMENFEVGFKIINVGMKEEQAEEFLEKEGFLPVLVTGGVLPSYLRMPHNFFRIRESDVQVLENMEFQSKLKDLKEYIIENIYEFQQVFENRSVEGTSMNQVLESVENLLFWYLKKVYSLDKNESANISEELGNFIRRLLQTSDEIIHAASEVSEELQGQICEFILKNQDLQMVDLNEEITCQIKRDSTIWYDDEYYYLTDTMLRKVCAGLLELVSVNELKSILKEEGILICDASGDYSVKITVKSNVNAQRIRVLKLQKIYLLADGQCLEDIYHGKGEVKNVQ